MKRPEIIKRIKMNPIFRGLKSIVENNPYHDMEDVYTHSLRTCKVAEYNIGGKFIASSRARKLFVAFADQDLGGLKTGDIMVITALLHDIGKAYVPQVNTEWGTMMPGHEARGAEVVDDVIGDLGFRTEQLELIRKVIRLHDVYSEGNLAKGLSVAQIKEMGEGAHIEILFNRYADCFFAKPFQSSLEKIRNIFVDKGLYS